MWLTVGRWFFIGVIGGLLIVSGWLLVGAFAFFVLVVCLLLVVCGRCWLVVGSCFGKGRWWLVVGSRYFLGLVAGPWSSSLIG